MERWTTVGIWGVQTVLLLLVIGDKWVHGITGKAPLEARLAAVEQDLARVIAKASENETRYMTKINAIDLDMREVQTTVKHNSTEILGLQGWISRLQWIYRAGPGSTT